MNVSALIAVAIFAVAFLAIFGALYASASKSRKQGKMGSDGTVVLRWALLGFLVIYGLLAVTAVLD